MSTMSEKHTGIIVEKEIGSKNIFKDIQNVSTIVLIHTSSFLQHSTLLNLSEKEENRSGCLMICLLDPAFVSFVMYNGWLLINDEPNISHYYSITTGMLIVSYLWSHYTLTVFNYRFIPLPLYNHQKIKCILLLYSNSSHSHVYFNSKKPSNLSTYTHNYSFETVFTPVWISQGLHFLLCTNPQAKIYSTTLLRLGNQRTISHTSRCFQNDDWS